MRRAPLKMRRSLAQFERAFVEVTRAERAHGVHLRRTAIARTHTRRRDRVVQSQFRRYLVLVGSLTVTVIAVSWAMFETLAWLMA